MLGVATLIVVNSVMGGFSAKLKDRLHGLLSDLIIEATTYEGIEFPEREMARIKSDPFLRDHIEAMTPTLEIFAMIQFPHRDETMIRPVHLIGIKPEGRAMVGGFAEHLLDPRQRLKPSFNLTPEAQERYERNNRPRVFLSERFREGEAEDEPALPDGDKPD